MADLEQQPQDPNSPHEPVPPPPVADEPGAGTQSLVGTLRLAFLTLRGVIFTLVVLYLFSGIFVVEPNEVAYVLRFGRVVRDEGGTPKQHGSGQFHLAFPRPIDRVITLPIGKTDTVRSTTFWYQEQSNIMNDQREGHGEGLTLGSDGYVLTGDYNIMHAKWTATYRITEPWKYYSRYSEPREIVGRALDQAVLHQVARTRIDDALYRRTDDLRLAIEAEVQRAVGPTGMDIGVEVSNVLYADKIPFRDAYAAFNRVVEAEQEKSKAINEAKQHANKVITEADGRAKQKLSLARSEKNRIVSSTEADADYFRKVLPYYRNAPETMLLSLYTQTVGEVMGEAKAIYTIREGQEIWYRLGPDPAAKKNDDTSTR